MTSHSETKAVVNYRHRTRDTGTDGQNAELQFSNFRHGPRINTDLQKSVVIKELIHAYKFIKWSHHKMKFQIGNNV